MSVRILLSATIAVVLGCLAQGCVAPGSASTRVRVSGRLLDSEGVPAPGKTVKIVLPATVGLAGLDAKMFSPSSFGHEGQEVELESDEKGNFEHTFKPVTYSAAIWLLPPLGAFPRYPPRPCFCVEALDILPHGFLLAFEEDLFSYRFADVHTGEWKSPVFWDGIGGVSATLSKVDLPLQEGTCKGWSVRLVLTAPKKQ